MWLYDNKQFFSSPEYRTRKRWCGVVLNIGLLVLATFLTVAGTYGSMCVSFSRSYRTYMPPLTAARARPPRPLASSARSVYIIDSEQSSPWTCADNSGSS